MNQQNWVLVKVYGYQRNKPIARFVQKKNLSRPLSGVNSIKKWCQVDHNIFFKTTKLKKLWWFCNCPSGESLINPCAHISAMLFFIFISQTSELEEWMKKTKRDTAIFDTIIDITEPVKTFIKKTWPKKYCKCQTPTDGRFMAKCDVCGEYYHPECILQIREDMEQEGWQCTTCSNSLNVISMFNFE